MTAPDHEAAERALLAVQSLDKDAIAKIVDDEIGPELLGVFSAFAKASDPAASDDEIAKKVHLMVLGYLLRREVAA